LFSYFYLFYLNLPLLLALMATDNVQQTAVTRYAIPILVPVVGLGQSLPARQENHVGQVERVFTPALIFHIQHVELKVQPPASIVIPIQRIGATLGVEGLLQVAVRIQTAEAASAAPVFTGVWVLLPTLLLRMAVAA
jgi:hypothetical protein